jgi:hypothetical protein
MPPLRITLTGLGTQGTLAQFSENLDAGKSFRQAFTTRIPARPQPGTYTVTGTASVSHEVKASDSFDLEKSQQ